MRRQRRKIKPWWEQLLLLLAGSMLIFGLGGLALEHFMPQGFGQSAANWVSPVSEKNAALLYKQAGDALKNKDYQSALALYSKLGNSIATLKPLIILHQAKACSQLGQEQKAQDLLHPMADNSKFGVLHTLAQYELAQSYLRANQSGEAKQLFHHIIADNPNSNTALGSEYYLGQLAFQAKNYTEAASHFRRYLKNSQNGTFSLVAAQNLVSLPQAKTVEDNEWLGLTYSAQNQWPVALPYLQKAPKQTVWLQLGTAFIQTGNTAEGQKVLTEGLGYSSSLDDTKEGLKALLALDTNAEPKLKALHQAHFKIGDDYILWQLEKHTDVPKRVAYANELLSQYPKSAWAPESSWTVMWPLYASHQWQAFLSQADTHLTRYAYSSSAPKVLFWKAKYFLSQGKTQTAESLLASIIEKYPNQYYAFRANQILHHISAPWHTETRESYTPEAKLEISNSVIEESISDPVLRPIISTLVRIGAAEDVGWLLDVKDGDKAPVILQSWVLEKQGQYDTAIRLIRDYFDSERLKEHWVSSNAFDALYYPVPYTDPIAHYAKQNRLDPFLVQALMRQESYFNPLAVSPSKAMGLMQMLPSTAQSVAKQENIADFQSLGLFNPEINIRLGTRYLKYLHDRFNGNSMLAVGAYNGGPNAMARWASQSNLVTQDPDLFIESINYTQTREYIKEVFSHYWNYQRLYLKTTY